MGNYMDSSNIGPKGNYKKCLDFQGGEWKFLFLVIPCISSYFQIYYNNRNTIVSVRSKRSLSILFLFRVEIFHFNFFVYNMFILLIYHKIPSLTAIKTETKIVDHGERMRERKVQCPLVKFPFSACVQSYPNCAFYWTNVNKTYADFQAWRCVPLIISYVQHLLANSSRNFTF